ncbi:hypothetical protein J3P96_16015 [Pseudomonas sp. R3-56]|uniref:hypothetical protein n=1 Tax=Pseudomonas sp. R3-56 TaxID=2817401 RepID=UPI003DA83334
MLYKSILMSARALLVAGFLALAGYVYPSEMEGKKNCNEELAELSYLPLASGLSIEKRSIGNLHAVVGRDKDECRLQYLEGAVIWDGKQAYPYGVKIDEKPNKHEYFTVVIAFGNINNCNDLAECQRKSAEGRPVKPEEKLVVNLDNYPGYSFHLNHPPPDVLNRDVLHLLNYEGKAMTGTTKRIFECHGLRSKSVSRPSETKIDQMMHMTLTELASIDFSENKSYCVLEFIFFQFRAGGGRLTLNINQLNEAAKAMPSLEQYFSNAIK